MFKEIPQGSIEIQYGLWLHEYSKNLGGRDYIFRELYASDGYCFWQVSNPENYNINEETGERLELRPLNERVLTEYASLAISLSSWTHEQLNAEFVSVKKED